MKTPSKNMLENEAILMGLFIVPMLLLFFFSIWGAAFWIYGLLLQLFIGIFQTITAVIRYFRHGSQVRKWWLLTLIIYLAVLSFGPKFLDYPIGKNFSDALWISMLVVIPSTAATFYWIFTILQAKGKYLEIDKPKNELISLDTIDDSDLLVDQILLKHKKRISK